ncbi:aminopeptidase P family protein [Streptomyces sp. HSW2009]|uniref:aminopeptidase P family protein n=1 Tax=Streptomyces sp. HSW2009 TaxID=3142890 RepID=UPI0032EEF0B5
MAVTADQPAPITREDYAARMARAGRTALDAGLAGLIVTPGPDLVHLCGYHVTAVTERLTALVITPDREPRLLVPDLERPDAAAAVGAGAVELVSWTDGDDPYEAAAKLLPPTGRYGIADSAWALHLLALQRTLPDTSYASLTAVLPMLRAVKDAHEVQRLAAAGAAADATYEAICTVRFAGRRECDIAADLSALLHEHGHSQVDFAIVGSGPNGASPHHSAGERVIEDGDMVVMDFGGLKDGYGSDTTRTVHVGEPTAEERKVHDTVRAAQQAAFEAVRPGVACQEIDRVARRVISEAGYGEYFIHRVGHGIGVTTHEPPYLVEGEHLPLVPGMCFSIEPGIYLRGRFGVRIEDIVTCTETGGRRLNNTSREMRVVS